MKPSLLCTFAIAAMLVAIIPAQASDRHHADRRNHGAVPSQHRIQEHHRRTDDRFGHRQFRLSMHRHRDHDLRWHRYHKVRYPRHRVYHRYHYRPARYEVHYHNGRLARILTGAAVGGAIVHHISDGDPGATVFGVTMGAALAAQAPH